MGKAEKVAGPCICRFGLIFCVVACFLLFIMCIVFSFCPWLTYPAPVFNVNNTKNNTFTLLVRCDYGSNSANLLQILTDCASSSWMVQPQCGTYNEWLIRPYSFGSVDCPSRWLQSVTATRDTSISWIALAFSLSLLGGFIFLIPSACLFYMCCTNRIPVF